MPISTSKMLSSNYLSGSDVEPFVNVTVHSVTEEEVGRDRELKTVVWFDEFDKGMVCNKTNLRNLINLLGASEDVNADWKGKQIQLYATSQEYGGDTYNVVRVRAVQPAGKGKAATPASAAPATPPGKPALTPGQAQFAAELKVLFPNDPPAVQRTKVLMAGVKFLADENWDGAWRELTDTQLAGLIEQLRQDKDGGGDPMFA